MENENRPHFKPNAVKYTKGYARRVFFSKLINFIIIVIGLIAISLTIYTYVNQPIKTENGYVTASHIQNRLPIIGEHVLVVETENHNMFTPLKRALINQNVYEAEIVAGPYGEIVFEEDKYVVIYADQTTSINIDGLNDNYLDKEFVVRKIDKEGNYVSNELDKVVEISEILGTIKIDEN